jgi:hypothetical protein
MEIIMKHRLINLVWLLAAVLAVALLGGCTPAATDGSSAPAEGADPGATTEHDSEHDNEHDDGGDHEEEGSEAGRIANEGAVVRIVSPPDGGIFDEGEEVVVQIEVENFELGEGHWHVYVDGSSWGMVTGGNTDEVLRGLAPGQHDIEVHLATGDHLELEQGDRVTIVVQE